MMLKIASAFACLAVAAGAAAAGEEATSQVRTNPDLYYLDHQDVSPPLRDMPVIPPAATEREVNPSNVVPLMPPVEKPKGWIDPLEALSHATERPTPEVGTVAGLNFEGVQGGAFPPDTNGAVGATQFVEWVNFSFAVYNKATGALVFGPAAGNTLWAGFGGLCETTNSGDPIVAYDKAAGRWVMTQFAFSSIAGGPWLQCVAVSTTSDATGTWRRFAYNFTALNDYPKLGVWRDAYYITFNMFNSGSTFAGARTCALDRNNMITAAGTPGPIQCFQNAAWASLLPADLDGATAPPVGAPNYQLSLGGSPTLRLYRFSVNWTTPALSTFTGPTNVTVAAYTQAPTSSAAPQPGTTVRLDALGDRLMNRLAYRNFGTHESLVVNHSVSTATTLGVRWYELRNPGGTPTVFQQGTFAPDATARWMGSIAQDRAGNMAVGYSVSSATVFPGLRYTGRLATDALGTMQTENVIVAGTRSQTNATRYGDYAGMTIDPVDDCMFWYTSEYLRTGTTTGSTRVASFRFPSCGAVPDFAVTCSPASLTLPRGTSVATTCTVTSSGGFASAVTLSCGSLPAGVTCAPSPNPVTPPANGSTASSVTFTASAAATLGAATVQVTGTSGATTRSASVTLNVTQPDFSIACNPASLSLPRNQSRSTTCTVTSTGGFSSAVALSCSSLPSGVTCASTPASVTPPANGSVAGSVTFTANGSAALGTFGVQVNGTSGATVRSANVTLAISDPLAVAISSTHIVATCTASGGTPGYTYAWWITPAFCDPCPGGCCLANGEPDVCCIAAREGRELPIPCPIQAPRPQSICPEEGPYTTVPANQWVWNGSEASIRCSASDATSATVFSPSIVQPPPPPDFALSCIPSSLPLPAGQSAATTCTVTSQFGFVSPVTLSCGNLPAGVTCAPSPNPVTPPANGSVSSSVTFTASAGTAAGSYTVQVNGVNGALSHSANVTLTVAVPDFSIACNPASLGLPLGQSRSTTCTVTSSGGFASPVALSCGNLGAGVTCSTNPSSVTPPANGSVNSTVTFVASAGATLGSFTAVVTGSGGSLTRSANVAVTVSNPLTAGISADYTAATCTASGGTPGYSYSWYVTPLSCVDPCPGGCCLANGEPDVCCIAAREGRELPIPCPIQAPRPQSICPEEGPFTSSPVNQWFWNGSEASVRCQVGDAAGAFALSASVSRPAPPADFTLTCSPTSLTAAPGGAAATTCTVTSFNAFASPVTLSCAGLPTGVSCSPSPNPITPPANGVASSSITFGVAAGTALGSYSVQVNGSGGSLTRSAGLTLNVSNAPLSATISAVPGVSATCNASGGTPGYTYRWYVRYPCDPCLMANKERTARGEPSLPCPINGPNPELICPWEGPYTSTPANVWTLFGGESGVRCNVIDAVGASVTVTQLL